MTVSGDLRDVRGQRGPLTHRRVAAGRLRAYVEVANAGQERALASYELALLEAYEDVENALVRHTREQLRRRSLREAVDANREAAALARRLYANGLGAFLDVLVAERSLLESESRLVESETAVSTSLVALYVALGGGWERAEELRGLSDADLSKELGEAYRQLFTVRLRLATRQQTNTTERTKVKRQIARIRTLQRERELEAAYAAGGKK